MNVIICGQIVPLWFWISSLAPTINLKVILTLNHTAARPGAISLLCIYNHGNFITWFLIKYCSRAKWKWTFDLAKAFVYIDRKSLSGQNCLFQGGPSHGFNLLSKTMFLSNHGIQHILHLFKDLGMRKPMPQITRVHSTIYCMSKK